MDQNKNTKVKEFFKKEGFYLVLFVCLCVVATASAFAIKNNKSEEKATENPNEFTLNIEEKADNASEIQRQNAERVQGNDQIAEQTTEESQEVAMEEQEVALED